MRVIRAPHMTGPTNMAMDMKAMNLPRASPCLVGGAMLEDMDVTSWKKRYRIPVYFGFSKKRKGKIVGLFKPQR